MPGQHTAQMMTMPFSCQRLFVCAACALCALAACALADLRADLRELRAFIPRRRVGFIAARHYIVDPRFRNAAEYLRGPTFSNTWRLIRDAPEVDDIIDYLLDALDVDEEANDSWNTALDGVPNRLRKLHLPVAVSVDAMLEKSFGTFLEEVLHTLPRTRIANWMARKVREGGEFAKLYTAMKQAEFQELLQAAKDSPHLAAPLSEFRAHDINVDELIDFGHSVLSWGP